MLDKHLEILEDTTFTRSGSRNQHFEAILHVLDKGNTPGVPKLERILTICVHDLKEDARHAVFCLNIITKIVNKHQTELPASKLALSAEAVLNFLLTAAALNKADSLQTISFNTLLAYPDNVLADLAYDCNNIYELLNLYCHIKMPVEIRFKPVNLTHRVMANLTPEKKSIFVKKGLAVWFSRVIPTAMNYFQIQTIGTTPMVFSIMEVLEMLTEELASIDYSTNPQWQTVLENIYSPNAYPAQMKNLLTSGSVLWHRIWIIFIKLLKSQITMNKPGVGSPINSMLPVVEMAFKMDVENRCKAFECWNVLIDNFSAETNKLFVEKRLKLLIIPLKSNNAKVEEIALAKLDTWWHLIKKFEARVDEKLLYPFLHFCFGRHVPENTVLVPGMISQTTKKNCVEAFVEMVGHVNCEGCISKPRLKSKIINSQILLDHWSDWIYSLKMAIKISAEEEVGIGKQPIMCAWKSFVMTINEMPENNMKNDLFNDLLTMTKLLAQESTSNNKLADLVNNILISSLLEETSPKKLLKTKEFESGPIQIILSILTDPTFVETCKKHIIQNLLINLDLISEFLVVECGHLEDKAIKWLIKDVAPHDSSLQLWTALVKALQVSKSRQEGLQQMCNLLLWPLLNLDHFSNVEAAALTWNDMYCALHLTTVQAVWFHMEIDRILAENENKGATATFFVLCVLLAVIKTKVITRTYEGMNKEVKMLQDVMCKYNDYDEIKKVFPILINTVDLLSTAAINERLVGEYVQDIFVIGRKVLNMMLKHFKRGDPIGVMLLVKVIDAFEHLFKTESGPEFKIILLDELLVCRTLFTTVPSNLDAILKLIMANEGIDQSLREKIKASLETIEIKSNEAKSSKNKGSETEGPDENKFTTPVTKSAKKDPKKKEACIINTVVENGEEFAVIKSNWKFNPRKLTENQKEKLKRKREDIPAMYQDLSQSQDEFKLNSWKTDSQDASTTNSRSASTPSNDNISKIKNMPGTDVVPNIIDNFFSTTPKATEKNENKQTDSLKQSKVDQPKSVVKPPRMALKDRVFRNVRNLIEKSTLPKDGSQSTDLINQTVNANTCSTPISKFKQTKNVVYSAPSKINPDRPARVKRKPKKFDDSEIYLEKKRRNSTTPNESQSFDKNDASEDETNLVERHDEDVNNTFKVSTISEKNTEIYTSQVCESAALTDDHETVATVEKVDTEKDKLPPEVSSSPIDKAVHKNPESDISRTVNLEDTVKCSQNDTSIDKSIEETRQPEQKKDISAGNTWTPKNITQKKDSDETKSTSKKKSRIEKELAIDMVFPPFLKLQSDKRVTRKRLTGSPISGRKNRLADKLNKSKTEPNSASKTKNGTSDTEVRKEKSRKNASEIETSSVTVCETQDISPNATQDLSEDVIESSQDTTTTISVKSFRRCADKRSSSSESIDKTVLETQDLVDKSSQEINTAADVMSQEIKDDTELPANKTDIQANGIVVVSDLTEEMDTEPISSGDVIIINDDDPVIDLNTECEPGPGPDTLELANADTQPTDPSQFVNDTNASIETSQNVLPDIKDNNERTDSKVDESQLTTAADDRTITLVDITQNEETAASSPTIGADQRKKDFLNSTSEISPIKPLSPIKPKSPVSEDSSDYIVIKLSCPVQMNGEPLELSNSPEIFTEEKTSPDKRDQSPPRPEVTVLNSSPSSALSLKKNRPQVRSGGRAAQMLGLCIPDRLQTIKHVQRPEPDEPKKSSPVSTPARRNLRMLYQTAQSTDSGSSDEKEEPDIFLKFKKALPSADCSPVGPILKRKLADIADEATASPANKRKRVSFHDPVSTSVVVQKYIETSGVPQKKRHQSPKPPKKNDNMLNLETVLTSTAECFSFDHSSNDTELSSLDQTPAAEIVKTSELNDTDPIFPDLIDCKDSIDNIASELSSPGMKELFVKELGGKIQTVGDLAKLSELEINRICIKAPKVQVAKKVLQDYASRKDKINKANKLVETNKELTVTTSDGILRKDEVMEVDKKVETDVNPNLTVTTSVKRSGKDDSMTGIKAGDTKKVTKPELIEIVDKTMTQLSKKSSSKDKKIEAEPTHILTNVEYEFDRINVPKTHATRKDKIMEVDQAVKSIVDVDLRVATSIGIQTNIMMCETETQTLILQRLSSTQTDEVMTKQTSSQTNESGDKSTEEIISSCIKDRKDFIIKLGEQLENVSKLKVAEFLPVKDCTDLLVKKMTASDAKSVLNSVIQRGCELHANGQNGLKELSYLQNYLCDKLDVKDMMLFCSQMLQSKADKNM